MKILLLNPPRSPENRILEYAPTEAKHFIHKKLIGPPLGLLTLAAALANHDLKLVDLKGEYDLVPDSPDINVVVTEILREFNPDIVGVTFIASEFYAGLEIFRISKNFNPEIITVAGGLHTVLSLGDFNESCVDYVCSGQSAGIFRDLIDTLECGNNPRKIGGLHIRTESGLIASNGLAKQWDAAGKDFIMPDRSPLKRWLNTYVVGGRPEPATYLFTSLGCPYECSFCSIWPQFKSGYLQRKVESVIEELKTLDEYPIVRFADANTIINPAFVNKLFDRIEQEGISKEFIMDIRFDTAVATPDLIAKLAKNGLKVVICGFESYRDEDLKKYKKGASAKLISQAIEIFHDNGIALRGNYVVPPDFDEDDFSALSDYASSHRVVYAGYTILTPMPGTVYFQEMKDQIIDHDLSKYNFFNSVMKTKLPLEKFYENVGKLWLIKKGTDII